MTDVLGGIIGQAHAGPDLLALKDQERQLTYSQLIDEVGHTASGLLTRGVAKGDRVALLLPNSVDFVVAALASLWIGAIFVPLATTDPRVRLDAMLVDSAPTVVITVGTPNAEDENGQSISGPSFIPFSTLVMEEDEVSPPVLETPRPVYSMYTSGTTGAPKGVLIGDVAFFAAVQATSKVLGLDRTTRTLCVSPFYFDGSFATLFPTLWSGGLVVIRPFSLLWARTFFDTVIDEQITYTGFSPSFLRLLLASPQMSKLSKSPIDVIALGGEACSVNDIQTLWSYAPTIRVFNRYGPTETTIVVSHQHLTQEIVAEGIAPIGLPHPGTTFHLVGEDGVVIEESDDVGELYIGGVQLMDGYWGAPVLSREVLRKDVIAGTTVYRTGDLMYRDHHGDFVYVDRANRVINRHGLRISLVEVSEAIRGLPHVDSAACIMFDNEGDVGIAAFVATNESTTSVELRRAALERLPEAMLPDRFEIVNALPMNKSNKLDELLLLAGADLSPLNPLQHT